MDGLGATALQCQQAFNAGDMTFFRSAGCSGSAENDKLLADKKQQIKTSTMVLIGGGVLITGLIIYFASTSKK
jgi:hypothetical protein